MHVNIPETEPHRMLHTIEEITASDRNHSHTSSLETGKNRTISSRIIIHEGSRYSPIETDPWVHESSLWQGQHNVLHQHRWKRKNFNLSTSETTLKILVRPETSLDHDVVSQKRLEIVTLCNQARPSTHCSCASLGQIANIVCTMTRTLKLPVD